MKIAFLTSGGVAPCLSASIGRLTENYLKHDQNIEIIGYLNGYKGLLLGNSISFPKSLSENIEKFYQFGGSPLGNSRVKLTNITGAAQRCGCVGKEGGGAGGRRDPADFLRSRRHEAGLRPPSRRYLPAQWRLRRRDLEPGSDRLLHQGLIRGCVCAR